MAHHGAGMTRVAAFSRSSCVVMTFAAALVVAGCVPTLPRWSADAPIEDVTQVSPAAGEPAIDGETTQVTAAPPPDVEVAVIGNPGESTARAAREGLAARPSGNQLVVPAGKTLYAIAREHDVAVRDLIELNRLDPPYRLFAGQRLKLPTERTYSVQRGDTLFSIARRLSIDLHVLVKRNALAPPYKVVTGTRLKLPSPSEPLDGTAASNPLAVASATVTPALPKPVTKPAQTLKSRQPTKASAVPMRSARLMAPPARAGASFFWPVKGKVVSRFGRQGGGVQHDGIAIAVPRGTPVKASENGVIAYAGSDLKAYGKLVLIRHADGWMTAYAYNDKLMVREGDVVRRGQVIAHAGSSGSARDSQTYFEIRHRGKPVDPLSHLTKS